ncbi:hypothetical protein EBU94_07195, partial [bacterium]|nr:hypothetical protein [bacterium]
MDERTKITKEEFEFFYKASNGNYSQIARDFDLAYFTLGKILEGTSWYSKEKYPSLGRNLHYVTEEEFKKIYKKNNGIYRKIKFDLGYNDDESLSKRLRIYPWFN